jgi:pyruvate dehydrogenase E2 component (dihydrolipoamide acetyltransferase)
MFGIDRFTAILNPPQAGVLAVGRVTKLPLVEDDRVVIRPKATFTLTADHRVVDGALARRFLLDLQNAIERPGVML